MPGTDFALRNQDYVRQHAAGAAKPSADTAKSAGTSDSFGFDDLLDIVNPLQHFPVVSTIYRHLTGDKIGLPAKIAGDTLFGGVTGFLCSVGDALFTEATGKSVGDTVYTALFGEGGTPAIAVAANDDAPAATDDETITMSVPPKSTPQQAAAAYRASGRLMAAY